MEPDVESPVEPGSAMAGRARSRCGRRVGAFALVMFVVVEAMLSGVKPWWTTWGDSQVRCRRDVREEFLSETRKVCSWGKIGGLWWKM